MGRELKDHKLDSVKGYILDINNGKIAPIYLLYGEEEYLVEKYVKIFTEAIVPPENRDFNLEFIDASITSAEEIVTIADTYPFLSGKKVLVIQNHPSLSSSKNKNLFDKIEELFEKGEESKAAIALLSYLDKQPAELMEMTKLELHKYIHDNEEDPLTSQQIDILDKLYFFIIEKNENLQNLSSFKDENFNNTLLESYLNSNQSEFSCFIFVLIGKVSKKNSIYKLIAEKGKIIEFSPDKSDANFYLEEIKKELKLRGYTITPQALKKIVKKTGNHLRQIFKEIDKIISYLGEKKIIDDKDIELLVLRTETEKIYELTDAITDKNINKAVIALNHLLEDQIHPLQIISGIITRFRFLLQCKLLIEDKLLTSVNSYPYFTQKIYPDLKTKSKELLPSNKKYNLLEQHPFVVYKLIQQSSKFTLDEIKKNFKKLLETDKQLKLSSYQPQLILELLIHEL